MSVESFTIVGVIFIVGIIGTLQILHRGNCTDRIIEAIKESKE